MRSSLLRSVFLTVVGRPPEELIRRLLRAAGFSIRRQVIPNAREGARELREGRGEVA